MIDKTKIQRILKYVTKAFSKPVVALGIVLVMASVYMLYQLNMSNGTDGFLSLFSVRLPPQTRVGPPQLISPPSAPANFKSWNVFFGKHVLSWTKSPGATGYLLFASPSPGTANCQNLSQTVGDVSGIEIPDSTPGVHTYYAVQATNAGGVSPCSSVADTFSLNCPVNATYDAGTGYCNQTFRTITYGKIQVSENWTVPNAHFVAHDRTTGQADNLPTNWFAQSSHWPVAQGAAFYIGRLFLSFQSAEIPDNSILHGATVLLSNGVGPNGTQATIQDTHKNVYLIDSQKTPSNGFETPIPLVGTDFVSCSNVLTGAGNAVDEMSTPQDLVAIQNQANLTFPLFASKLNRINKTGTTEMCMREEHDWKYLNYPLPPTSNFGINMLWLYGTGAGGVHRSQLAVEYTPAGFDRLSPPFGMSASDGTQTGAITVNWEPVPGATGYKVYRYANPAVNPCKVDAYLITPTPITNTTITESPVPSGQTQRYQVTAIYPGGEGECSDPDNGQAG